jgi:magnesium transporter
MPRAIYYKADGETSTDISPDEYAGALADSAGVLWVDFTGEEPKVAGEILLSIFGFHPLAVDDALHETHVPKVDDWEKYLYIAMLAVSYESRSDDIDTIELDIFLGENYIVTHHDFPIKALDRVWDMPLSMPETGFIFVMFMITLCVCMIFRRACATWWEASWIPICR